MRCCPSLSTGGGRNYSLTPCPPFPRTQCRALRLSCAASLRKGYHRAGMDFSRVQASAGWESSNKPCHAGLAGACRRPRRASPLQPGWLVWQLIALLLIRSLLMRNDALAVLLLSCRRGA